MNLFKTTYPLARQLPELFAKRNRLEKETQSNERLIQLAEAEGEEMLLDASENKDFWD